jgi:putative ABC transport system permease protein
VFRLALASLRFRIAASLAVFVAVLIGCALFTVCGGLLETAVRLQAPPQRLAGAPIVVAGPSGYRLNGTPEVIPYSERARIPSDVAGVITGTAGVTSAVPDTSFLAVMQNSQNNKVASGGLYGHDWESARLTPYQLSSGSAPDSGQVVLDSATAKSAGLKVGDPILIAVTGAYRSFTVSGIAEAGSAVQSPQAPQSPKAPALFFSRDDIKRFPVSSDYVDAYGVFAEPGTNIQQLAQRLRQKLPADTSVLTGNERGLAEFNTVVASRLPLFLLAGILSGMVMFVLVLVVSASIGLSVRQRQQELALLRATGATPGQVRRMVVIETMIVAILAIAGGMFAGSICGSWLFALSAEHGVLPAALEYRQGPIPFAASTFLILLIVWTTAQVTAGSAARTRPIQALVEASILPVRVSPLRRRLAIGFAVATAAIALASMFMGLELAVSIGGSAVLTGAVAIGLLAPEVIYKLVAPVAKIGQRFAGSAGFLAVKNVQARSVQFAAVLIPLTLGIAIALGNIYAQTTQEKAALRGYLTQFHADAAVTSEIGGVVSEQVKAVRDTPGIAAASPLVTSKGWIEKPYDASHGSDPWPLLGIDTATSQHSFLATPVREGSLRNLIGNSAAIPQERALALGVKLGDHIGLRLGDGAQVTVKVVALLGGSANYASIVLPVALLGSHTTTMLPPHLLIRSDGTLNQAALMHDIKEKIGSNPAVQVGDKQLLADGFAAQLNVQAWISYLLAFLAIGYAAIAAINALAVIALGRQQEFAVQRLLGSTRGQIIRMLLAEAALITVAALILGTALALFTIVPIAVAVGPLLPQGPAWAYPAVVLTAFLISLPIVVWTGQRATRRKADH